ncbi:dhal domain-containing protein [Amylocarpus encephaloides]|uniref:Dhal domain-containing protein n=1 Tax=Amylocarpus encephaloides TaxID=45428 RepID=A0A9P8C2E8_9HELO|nr:dhal domain-containing protein [Amylocarpus encephaloides]
MFVPVEVSHDWRVSPFGHPAQVDHGGEAQVQTDYFFGISDHFLKHFLQISHSDFSFPALPGYIYTMSLVVEQTLPYTPTQLKLDEPTRWSRLFPLIRPSAKAIDLGRDRSLVVDTALAKSKNVLIAAIGSVGNFSSKILGESHLAAIAAEPFGIVSISAKEIAIALKENGLPVENGVLVLRASTKQDIKVEAGIMEVSLIGELKLDHILSLLVTIHEDIKISFEKTQELLQHFVKSAARTTSKFHETKSGNGPSVIHAVEVAEFNSAKIAVEKDLSQLLSSRPTSGDVVYSIHCSDINGLSRLENNILVHEIFEYLAQKNLASRISHSTIQDNHSQARGWALSFCPMPTAFLSAQTYPSNTLATSASSTLPAKAREGSSKIQLSDSQVRKIITAGCERVIKEEPTITEYDTIVGDGDCGYTLRDGAKQVLNFIVNADLATLPSALGEIVEDLEVNMGGTSGALYCIFLTSLSQNLWDAPTFAGALRGALEDLLKYTRARLGDRTCLDCLIPFVETLQKTGDSKKALGDAEKGVETTKKLEAKLGRSSYLDEAATRGVPDPGAYGLLMLLEGMVAAKRE